jgi:hypothetical protein
VSRQQAARRRIMARLDEMSEERAGRILREAFKVLAGASVGLAQVRATRMRWRVQRDVLDGLRRSEVAASEVSGAQPVRELPDGTVTLFGLPVVETDEDPGRWGLTLEIAS